jgi:hypothetical protein
MRLKEIVAEALYLKDANHEPFIPFPQQDSSVRDYYHKLATTQIPQLLSSYFGNGKSQMFYRFIDGCITDFINQHGNTLNANTKLSLIKRIISRLPEYTKQSVARDGEIH